jgi:TPR repeat protein
VKYFKQAANQKGPKGFCALGICSFFGFGCCVDRTKAEESFRLGADLGDGIAAFNYGLLLSHHSTSESEARYASKYYRHSAFKNMRQAQINYGVCLFEG